MNSLLFYFEADTPLLFGRKPGERTWIPSLKDFDIKILERFIMSRWKGVLLQPDSSQDWK